MKLISYQRSATKVYSSEPKSVRKQRSACKFWAIKNKHKIVERYYDGGFGSYIHLAPSFQEIIIKIQQGNPNFEGLVVHSFSRISRNYLTLIQVKKFLKKHNIKLFSVTEYSPIISK